MLKQASSVEKSAFRRKRTKDVGMFFCSIVNRNLRLTKNSQNRGQIQFDKKTIRLSFPSSSTVVVYKKAFDTRRAGRILIRHQPPQRHHKSTNHRVYNYTITNN